MKRLATLLAIGLFGCFQSSGSGSDAARPDSGLLEVDSGAMDGSRVDSGPDCRPSPESCNVVDDDCDGLVDENPRSLCSGVGEACIDGSCACPAGSLCDGSCVDLDRSNAHCGSCDNRCEFGTGCGGGRCCELRGDDVDLLLVIDNSSSMTQEQVALTRALPFFIEALTQGDIDGDGDTDFVPVNSLQVGVVTTDMGTNGNMIPTCGEPNFGEDGLLRTTGNRVIPGCAATYPNFLEYRAGLSDPTQIADDLTCVASVGTDGCGVEQQLEAALKAASPSTAPIRFHADTTGHGDGENEGLIREDALLLVILLTDEEDCSFADPELFNPSSALYPGDLNLRCFQFPEAVHPVRRFVDGLIALKTNPRRLMFAAIAGIPEGLIPASGLLDYDAILSDELMTEVVDPDRPWRLRPSCNRPGTGVAFPPRRIVRAAEGLETRGAQVVLDSICQDDYAPFMRRVLRGLTTELTSVCE
ncbi:MAG: hypothetical protein AAGE52_37190 [Myxococcota bacterium]